MTKEPLGNPRPPQFTLRALLVLTAVIAMLLGITVPAVRTARETARRVQCANNLKQTALGMHSYLDHYKYFAPAYEVGKEGRRVNCWRVQLLEYLVEKAPSTPQSLHDEPWDSPTNLRLTSKQIYCYHCPSDPSAAPNETNYTMIVGPGMFAEGQTSIRLEDITDGVSNTIMLVETVGAKIPWAAPRDLEADKITFAINAPKIPGISSEHSGGAYCAMVDGAVRFLSNTMTPEQVRALCTRSGGEAVEEESPLR